MLLLDLPPPGNTDIFAYKLQYRLGNTCMRGGDYNKNSTCCCQISLPINISITRAILISMLVKLSTTMAILTCAAGIISNSSWC